MLRARRRPVVYEGCNHRTARYRRAHRNALQNTPFLMTTALVLTLTGASATVGGSVRGYAAARILHSICYAKEFQPFRTIFFVLGTLLQLAVLSLIGYSSLA